MSESLVAREFIALGKARANSTTRDCDSLKAMSDGTLNLVLRFVVSD